jgi:branched-chain amino acid transport system substrate-binding protein
MDTSPLRIGYCLSLSGGLASNGKTAQLAHQIWRERVNASGGLLERPIELVCLDDQTNPKLVAELYQRLLDVEKVDVVGRLWRQLRRAGDAVDLSLREGEAIAH